MDIFECVRLKNVNPLMDEYLKKLIQEIGYELKFLDWDGNYVGEGFPIIISLNSDSLSDLKVVLEKRKDKVIIALNSRKDFKLVAELKSHFTKVFGFIDISQEVEYNIPIMNNYLNLKFTNYTYDLEKLANQLEKIQEHTQTQLYQIKDIHERLVKMRVDKFNSLHFTSKFMSGEKSGGEFFEFVKNEKELAYIQVGSNSYHLSSMVLSEIQALKERNIKVDIEKEIILFEKTITLHAKENNSELSYCVITLNLKTLTANFILKGLGAIFYQDKMIGFDKPVSLKLKPTDRLFIISQGVINNWNIFNPKKPLETFFLDNVNMESKELVNEFFLEVSRNKTGKFLIHDALISVLEIEDNVVQHLHFN